MCIFYGDIQPNADTEAIADRLKQEFQVQLEAVPAAMAQLLRDLDGRNVVDERK